MKFFVIFVPLLVVLLIQDCAARPHPCRQSYDHLPESVLRLLQSVNSRYNVYGIRSLWSKIKAQERIDDVNQGVECSSVPSEIQHPQDAHIIKDTQTNNSGTFNNSDIMSGNYFKSNLTMYDVVHGDVENQPNYYNENNGSIKGSTLSSNSGPVGIIVGDRG